VDFIDVAEPTHSELSGYEGIIEKLTEYGADPFKRDASHKTARAVAAGLIFPKATCVDMLLKYGKFIKICKRIT
jgi:hypothetical protein